jgi:hypothetical protein
MKYKGGKIVAIWDVHKQHYVEVEKFQDECDEMMGSLPASKVAWKDLLRNKKKDELLLQFFNDLKASGELGAILAVKYGKRSKKIGEKLVADKVADEIDHVNTVMLTGFYHAYGPVNNFFD